MTREKEKAGGQAQGEDKGVTGTDIGGGNKKQAQAGSVKDLGRSRAEGRKPMNYEGWSADVVDEEYAP